MKRLMFIILLLIFSVSFANSKKENWVTIEAEVTAYCICEKCCGKKQSHPNFGLTASGHRIFLGDNSVLVAAGRDIPFGSLLKIEGYNNGDPVQVLDRGGAITAGKFDVLFNASVDPNVNHHQARGWGRRKMEVQVLKCEK